MTQKIVWQGTVTSVQPRIRLLRSFDERQHSYLGYTLEIDGAIGNETRPFSIAIGKAAQAKHQFQIKMQISGEGIQVADSRMETAELYKVSKLKILGTPAPNCVTPPPWLGVAPELPIYRERGHRRLSTRTYASKCSTCIWGCRMPVEMTIDHWNPGLKKYRFETFCYGPKSCTIYRAGPCRTVPGRKGMSWTEEDRIEEEETAHRDMDE